MDASEAIKEVYKDSRNPFTPQVFEYGWIKEGSKAYELSKGYSYYPGSRDNTYLIGVSIVSLNRLGEWKKSYQDSKLFTSEVGYYDALQEARRYIKHLEEE